MSHIAAAVEGEKAELWRLLEWTAEELLALSLHQTAAASDGRGLHLDTLLPR